MSRRAKATPSTETQREDHKTMPLPMFDTALEVLLQDVRIPTSR